MGLQTYVLRFSLAEISFLKNFFSLSPRLSLWVNTGEPQLINLFLLVHCFKMRLFNRFQRLNKSAASSHNEVTVHVAGR